MKEYLDPGSTTGSLVDTAAKSADSAIRTTRRAAHEAVDRYAEGAEQLRAKATETLGHVAGRAEEMADHGVSAVKEASHRLREQTHHAAESTRGYIRDEPVKSMLMAAAAGAVIAMVAGAFGRRAHR